MIVAEPDVLRRAPTAGHDEVMALIERQALFGQDIGYVDMHLLAATLLVPGTRIWTRDRRLEEAADKLGIAVRPVALGGDYRTARAAAIDGCFRPIADLGWPSSCERRKSL